MIDNLPSVQDIVNNVPQTVEEMEKIIAFADALLRLADERLMVLRFKHESLCQSQG